MPTINISDRIEQPVAEYSADQAASSIKITSVQKVLEGGRPVVQLLHYPEDGSDPTGYVVSDAWFNQSGLYLDRVDGYLTESEEGRFSFARRQVLLVALDNAASQFVGNLLEKSVAAEVPAVDAVEQIPAEPTADPVALATDDQTFGDDDASVLESEPSKKRKR